MTQKRYRLTKLRLNEISIVDQGADPNAVVTIFKRDDRSNGGKPMTDLEKMVAQMKEPTDTIANLQASVTKANADSAVKDAAIADLTKRLAAAEAAKGSGAADDEDPILKAADPLVAAEIVKLRKANAAAAKQLAQLDEEREIKKVATQIQTDMRGLPVKADEFAPILKRAIGAMDESDSKELLRVLKAASNAVEDSLRSTGLPAHLVQKSNAEAQIEDLAKAKQKAENITFAKAYDQVLAENPALYSRFLAERDQAMN
jgi:hypothetical protein